MEVLDSITFTFKRNEKKNVFTYSNVTITLLYKIKHRASRLKNVV